MVSLEALARAICERFSGWVGEGNVAAARAAYAYVEDELRKLSGADVAARTPGDALPTTLSGAGAASSAPGDALPTPSAGGS
jgi:hypothetical protein